MPLKKYKLPNFYLKILLLACWVLGGKLGAQNPTFTASQEITGSGNLVTVEVRVQNFENIGTFQFSMNWDTDVLTFQNTADYGFSDLDNYNFGTNNAENGVLTALWFDQALQGETLPDDALLFSIVFEAIGEIGDSSLLTFTDMPTDIFVAQLDGTSIEEIPATFEAGEVKIISTEIIIEGQSTNIFCFDESNGTIEITLTGGLPPYQINWTGPNNFSSDQVELFNLITGTYTVLVTDSFGSSATETFEITAPSAALSLQNTITEATRCDTPTGTIEVLVDGGTPPYSYDFGQGFSGNNLAQNLAAGEYSITILDANNCELSAATSISEAMPTLIILGQDTAICRNEELILSTENLEGIYIWQQDGNVVGNTTNALEILETGTYSLQFTNEFGCISGDTVEVELKELDISISSDTTIFTGMSVQLFVDGGTDYFWQPADFLSCQTCPDPIATPKADTYFVVDISTSNGCFTSDSVFVNISNELELVIDPINFFTPNNDGKNDRLVFEGLEMFPQNSLVIYNRWGNKIYDSFNYQQNGNFWDGTLNGNELPAGVYYYILRVDANGTEIKTSLTLTR